MAQGGREMSFSDSDLARLKDDVNFASDIAGAYKEIRRDCYFMEHLINRLEAAEVYIKRHYQECEGPACCATYDRWRKACGKD